MPRYRIEIAAEQPAWPIDRARLKKVVRLILEDAEIRTAEISIAIVDDLRMHELNRQYLNHDYTTDVLSFVLEQDPNEQYLDGEIVACADYAAREAPRYEWSPDDELLLYILHGTLHLIGHDDTTPEKQQTMREAEAKYLAQFGLNHRYEK